MYVQNQLQQIKTFAQFSNNTRILFAAAADAAGGAFFFFPSFAGVCCWCR